MANARNTDVINEDMLQSGPCETDVFLPGDGGVGILSSYTLLPIISLAAHHISVSLSRMCIGLGSLIDAFQC